MSALRRHPPDGRVAAAALGPPPAAAPRRPGWRAAASTAGCAVPRPTSRSSAPFPPPGERHGGWTGVASYAANLADALGDAGARVTVVAPPRRACPPSRATAASRSGAAGSAAPARCRPRAPPRAPRARPPCISSTSCSSTAAPAAVPGIVPALAALRAARRRAVVTMHHVVDPGGVDRRFRPHPPRAGAGAGRAGAVAGVQRAIGALADTVVVHEPSFARVGAGATVVPHGIEVARPRRRGPPRGRRSGSTDRLFALCFGFLAPYKGLETALDAARLAGPASQLVVAGAAHPRHRGSYARRCARTPRQRALHRLRAGRRRRPLVRRRGRGAAALSAPVRVERSARARAGARHPGAHVRALAATTGAPPELSVPRGSAALAARLRELAADPAPRRAARAGRPRWPPAGAGRRSLGAISSSTTRRA